MTKKDYVLIANALRSVKPQQGNVIITKRHRYHTGKVMQFEQVCDVLMKALAQENPLFSKDKFRTAIDK